METNYSLNMNFVMFLPLFILNQIAGPHFAIEKQYMKNIGKNTNKSTILLNGNLIGPLKTEIVAFPDCESVSKIENMIRSGELEISSELDEKMTPFSCGCACGNEYLIQKGLDAKIDLNKKYQRGFTALMFLIHNHDLKSSIKMLEYNLDVNITNDNLDNALNMAVQYLPDTFFIERLLDLGAEINQRNNIKKMGALEIAYFYAGEHVFANMMGYVLKNNRFESLCESDILNMSIISADTSILKLMLQKCEPEIDAKKGFQFMRLASIYASLYNNFNKYRGNAIDTTSGMYNTVDLDIKIFDVLKNHGYELNLLDSLNRNIFFYCMQFPEVGKYLIKEGININQIDINGKTALKYFIDDIVSQSSQDLLGYYNKIYQNYALVLSILDFYIKNGAKVDLQNGNPWDYIFIQAKTKGNLVLSSCILEKYKSKLGISDD